MFSPFPPPNGRDWETLYSCFHLFPTRWRGLGNPLFLFSPFPHQMAWSGKASIPVFPFSPPDGVVWESLYSRFPHQMAWSGKPSIPVFTFSPPDGVVWETLYSRFHLFPTRWRGLGKPSIPVFTFSPPDGVVWETLYSRFHLFPTRWRGLGKPLFPFSRFPHQMAWYGKASIPVFPFSPPDGVVWETLYSRFHLFPAIWRGLGKPLFPFSPFPRQMAWSGKASIPVFTFSPPDGVVRESLNSRFHLFPARWRGPGKPLFPFTPFPRQIAWSGKASIPVFPFPPPDGVVWESLYSSFPLSSTRWRGPRKPLFQFSPFLHQMAWSGKAPIPVFTFSPPDGVVFESLFSRFHLFPTRWHGMGKLLFPFSPFPHQMAWSGKASIPLLTFSPPDGVVRESLYSPFPVFPTRWGDPGKPLFPFSPPDGVVWESLYSRFHLFPTRWRGLGNPLFPFSPFSHQMRGLGNPLFPFSPFPHQMAWSGKPSIPVFTFSPLDGVVW